jgi:hypothetical protein
MINQAERNPDETIDEIYDEKAFVIDKWGHLKIKK